MLMGCCSVKPADFPSINARASLKRGAFSVRGRLVRDFPSINARASLKRHLRRRSLQHRLDFPSINARASLKQGQTARIHIGVELDFPSINARASLKRPLPPLGEAR